ncbi:MAG: flavin reductase family protein, partial [Dehalococcoidia bacterium]
MLAYEQEVKQVMDEMPYGLYIVGSKMDAEVNGMMADWVMQVSISPRLVAVSFENDARTLQNLRESRVFTVNLLSQDQDGMDVAAKFAQPYYGAKVKGRTPPTSEEIHHKLVGVRHSKSKRGCPVLEAAMAWLECEVEQFLPVGDHIMVIGRVVDGRVVRSAEPLTSAYTGYTYSG